MNSRLLLICLSVLLFSCKASKDNSQQPEKDSLPEHVTADTVSKPEEEPLLDYDKAILNTWNWYKTDCCFRTPHTTYAASLPYVKQVKFNNDGTMQIFHGDTLKETRKFEVHYGLMDGDNRPVLRIDNRPALLYFRQDTLVIDFGYMDLQTEFYLLAK